MKCFILWFTRRIQIVDYLICLLTPYQLLRPLVRKPPSIVISTQTDCWENNIKLFLFPSGFNIYFFIFFLSNRKITRFWPCQALKLSSLIINWTHFIIEIYCWNIFRSFIQDHTFVGKVLIYSLIIVNWMQVDMSDKK